jgi:hypothetical protein
VHLLLVPVARLGVRHPIAWRLAPFVLLAAGVFGFMWLADRYAWHGGTRLFIALLLLALFALIAGPLALLPELRRKRDEHDAASAGLTRSLVEDLATGASVDESWPSPSDRPRRIWLR